MEIKKFDQEVKDLRNSVDEAVSDEKKRQSLLDNETLLALIFSKGLRLIDKRPYDYQIATMIAKFKDYRSSNYGYSFDEALTATMLHTVKWDSDAHIGKVDIAIEKLKAYNPKFKMAYIKFKNKHRILVVLAYVLWCAMIFVGTQYWVTQVTHDAFTRYFAPSIVTLYYAAFSHGFLRRKRY